MISIKNLKHYYIDADGNEVKALDGVSLDIEQGEFVAIIGANGSGKSTLARHINALLLPTEGEVLVDGMDTADDEKMWDIRQRVGMVFQNPDNQIVAAIVEEDVAFGPENIGVPCEEIRPRVEKALAAVGMTEYAKHAPHLLSGGQKQRVAIARALASNPKILLCDEATSALDPQTTKSILALLKEINQKYGITIVIITHEMAVVREICNRVGIIGAGHLVETGEVLDVFSHPQSKEAKELVMKGASENTELVDELQTKKCVRIVFSANSSFEPVIANMVLRFQTPVNILKADTKNVGGIAHGEMILGLPEDEHISQEMIQYLKERNLAVEEVSDYVG